jgi:thiol-disulfide isomerase/thioredoxin
VNVGMLRMDQQAGRPVLVEFWDFCRPNSLRTLPYVKAWHQRYAAAGLRVIGVHSPGFEPSRDNHAARAAVERLGIEHAVLLDPHHAVWDLYENAGWPARYLFDQSLTLVDFHYGEGAYAETERAIQELLGVDRDVVAPVHPEDDPEAPVVAQTADHPGPWSGPYEAGGVWAVLDGRGEIVVNGRTLAVDHPGAHAIIEHECHTAGVLDLQIGDGVTCHAVCFTPGVAPP